MGFYRLTAGRRYAEIRPGAEGVVASEVLPGFQFRWSDLHKLPDLEELALDEVYAAYVIPSLQNAVNRAEGEAASRRQAEERAERAEERAEGEAASRRQAEERAERGGGTDTGVASRISPTALTSMKTQDAKE